MTMMVIAQKILRCPDHIPSKSKNWRTTYQAPVEITSHPVEPPPQFHYDCICKSESEAGGEENPQLFFKKLISIPAVISPG